MILKINEFKKLLKNNMYSYKMLWIAALGLLSFFTKAQTPNRNIQLRSNLSLNFEDYANIWGHVDAVGNEYALLGNYRGLTIVDVTNPDSIFVVKHITGVYNLWREVKTWGNYAYVTTEGGGGLQIINMSSLPDTNGIEVKYWQPNINGEFLNSIHALHIEDGFVYCYGSNIGNGGAVIGDLTDPWNPVFAGLINLAYIHDGYVRNDTVYAGHIYDGKLRVWDCRNKSNPVLINEVLTPQAFTHNSWLSDNGKTVYTTDEVNGSACVAYDISDLNNITLIDREFSQNPQGGAPVHNTHVRNDFVYNSYYTDGVTIVDGHRPTNLVNVGWFDTSPLSGGTFEGCWGVYPFLPSGNILASDRQTGLWVLSPNIKRACYVEGIVRDSSCNSSLSDVNIKLIGPDTVVFTTSSSGIINTGTPESGTYSIEISKPGYQTQFINAILQAGVVYNLNVNLRPVVPVNLKIKVTDKLGNPLTNVKIYLTDSNYVFNGVYNGVADLEFCGLNAGLFHISASKWGYTGYCETVLINGNNQLLNIQLDRGYYDDFQFDNNWQVNGNATSGIWQRGEPMINYVSGTSNFKPLKDVENDCGKNAFVTGQEFQVAGTQNVDNGYTELISPYMDLRDMKNPILKFNRWLFTTNISDTLYVWAEYGQSRKKLMHFQKNSDSLSHWVFESFKLKDSIPLTDSVRIHFFIEDKAPSNILEAAIDVFSVIDTTGGVGSEKVLLPSKVLLIPNPNNGKFSLQKNLNDNKNQWIIVYNALGIKVYENSYLFNTELDLSFLPTGTYFIKLNSENIFHKFIKY
jgi:choice-of-anchor B domain-containing protein